MTDRTRRTRLFLAAIVAVPMAFAGCDDDDNDLDNDIDEADFEEVVVRLDVDIDDPVLVDTDGDAIADSTVESLRLDVVAVELGFTDGGLLDMDVVAPTIDLMDADGEDIAEVDTRTGRFFDSVVLTFGPSSEIEFDGVTAPLLVRGGTEGIVVPADFCIEDDLLSLAQRIELSLDVPSNLNFEPDVGEFVLEGSGFQVEDAPECDDDD